MATFRALAAAALLSLATTQALVAPAPVEHQVQDAATIKLTPFSTDASADPNIKGLQEQLGSSITSLAKKTAAEAEAEAQKTEAVADTETEATDDGADGEDDGAPAELEMFTGPKNARIVGKLPKGLPLASLQVVQHGRLLIVIYHLGGKHTTGVEHHFVLEFEPVKPGVAQYSTKDGSFSYTVPRPVPFNGGSMQHVPVSVEKGKKGSKKSAGRWVKAKTKSGKTYYYNTKTRKTRWTKPSALLTQDDSEISSTNNLRASASAAGSLPKSLEMKEKPDGALIQGTLPKGLVTNSLQVLQHDQQIIVNYQLGEGTGNVGVEQRFVLSFEPLKLANAKYNSGSGSFTLMVQRPKPISGGAVLHIPITLKKSSGKKRLPRPPRKRLIELASHLKEVKPAA